MGRQINFYMDRETEQNFLQYLGEEGYTVLLEDLQELSVEEPAKRPWWVMIYKEAYGKPICNGETDTADVDRSPVIEFIRTRVNEEKKCIQRGRLWISMENEFADEKARDLFLKDYNRLVRWLKKNIPNQEYQNNGCVQKGLISDSLRDYGEKGYRYYV